MRQTIVNLLPYLDLYPACRLIVLCGSNQKLYGELRKRYRGNPQILLRGATRRMALYMKACEIVFSKPGRLSSTEAAAAGVPLVHIAPIPGVESRNARFFQMLGMSLPVNNQGRELLAAVAALQRPRERKRMRDCQRRQINPRAAADICDFFERQITRIP